MTLKGIAACMIQAAEKLKEQKLSVGLLFVVGEEVSSDGAKAAAKYGVKSKICCCRGTDKVKGLSVR